MKEFVPRPICPEALACMDEYAHDENAFWFEGEVAKYENSGDFTSVAIVKVALPRAAIEAALCPKAPEIVAAIEPA